MTRAKLAVRMDSLFPFLQGSFIPASCRFIPAHSRNPPARDPETKKIVSVNALRDGLTGQLNLMPEEDRAAHDEFCAAIIENPLPQEPSKPSSSVHRRRQLAHESRARRSENNIFAAGSLDPAVPCYRNRSFRNRRRDRRTVFAADPGKFQLISLSFYKQRANREMQKTLDRFTAMQAGRGTLRQQDTGEAATYRQYKESSAYPSKQMTIPVQMALFFDLGNPAFPRPQTPPE
jgi:hypothetical protein